MAKKFILCLLAAALVLFTQLGNLRDLIRSTHMDCEELIYDALWEERDSIALAAYRLTPEELGDHWNHVIYDSAELFYVSDRYEYKAIGDLVLSVSPGYVATGSQLDTARTLYNEALDTILQGIHPDWNDLQIALYLNDYLCSHYAYDKTLSRYSAYELLTDGTGVCQAYTLAYNALLTACGIDCSYVVSREMNHAWNVVTINGDLYNVDVTYNDPTPDRLGKVSHSSFLRSDEAFTIDHSFTYAEGYGQCFDSFYDKGAVWENVNTAFVPLGEDFYYIKSGMLYRWDGTFSEYIDTIYATWFTDRGDQSYWKGNYSALWAHDGKLLYSKPQSIIAYDPADNSFTTFYTHKGSGDIYGFAIHDNTLYLQLSRSPNESGEIIAVQLN